MNNDLVITWSEIIKRLQGMKKGELKKGVASLVLTSIIILTLVLMTPAQAVELNISTDKATYKINDIVTFNFKIDIQQSERVPIKELTLKINNIEKCKFKVNGEIISGCQNMTINQIQALNYGYGYMQGTGFGHNGATGIEQTTYGYGYGYGYSPMEPSELKYEIKWTTTENDFGDHEAILEAFAQNNEEEFTYISNTANFKIRKGILASQAKAEVNAGDGEATIKGMTFEENTKNKVDFYGDLRSVDSEAAGTIALNADMYKDDGTHRTLQVRMKPKILDDFHRDMIEVEGLAKIEIKTTKKGTKNEKILDEVHVIATVDIKNRMVKIVSEDSENPFSIENMKIKSLDYREYQKSMSTRKGIPVQLTEVFRLSF